MAETEEHLDYQSAVLWELFEILAATPRNYLIKISTIQTTTPLPKPHHSHPEKPSCDTESVDRVKYFDCSIVNGSQNCTSTSFQLDKHSCVYYSEYRSQHTSDFWKAFKDLYSVQKALKQNVLLVKNSLSQFPLQPVLQSRGSQASIAEREEKRGRNLNNRNACAGLSHDTTEKHL